MLTKILTFLKIIVFCRVFLFVILLPYEFTHGETMQNFADLRVEFNGFRNDNGQLMVALFKDMEEFPEDRDMAFQKDFLPIAQSTTIEYLNIPYGNYVIMALHDENSDGEMETNLIGIPLEGYGISNNAIGFFGQPVFEEAQVIVSEDEVYIQISMYYK